MAEMTETLPVERIAEPTAAAFHRLYVRRAQPVIITGAVEKWPAWKKWSVPYFRAHFADRRVPVFPLTEGYTRPNVEDRVEYDESVTVGQFLDTLDAEASAKQVASGYMMGRLHDYFPELEADLPAPTFAPPAPWGFQKWWLSGPGTVSLLHTDLPDNLFAQFVGKKRVTLFPPRDEFRLYREPLWSTIPMCSRVDPEAPDYHLFPRLRGAHPRCVILGPGDILYIPRRWWHHVRTLETSISASYWWSTGLNYLVIRCALAYQKFRKLVY
jgi:cupin-like protein